MIWVWESVMENDGNLLWISSAGQNPVPVAKTPSWVKKNITKYQDLNQ